MKPGALAACVFFVAASARAGAPDASDGGGPRATEERPVAAYGYDNPNCLKWTDGCIICQRAQTDGSVACSTPGIACLPAAPVCSETKIR